MAGTLANGGICPVTEEDIINATCVRDVLSLMYSCGMYDYSGQFAFKVSQPAKLSIFGEYFLFSKYVHGVVRAVPDVGSVMGSYS